MQPVPQYGSSSADQAYEQPPTGLQADVSLAMLPIAVGAPHYADWSPVSEPVYATVFCIFCLLCLFFRAPPQHPFIYAAAARRHATPRLLLLCQPATLRPPICLGKTRCRPQSAYPTAVMERESRHTFCYVSYID